MKTDNANRLADPGFQGNSESKKMSSGGGHFDHRWKAENLIRLSALSWVTSRKKLRDPIINFQVTTLTSIFLFKKSRRPL